MAAGLGIVSSFVPQGLDFGLHANPLPQGFAEAPSVSPAIMQSKEEAHR
jgi:hypothetical protein